MDRDTNYVNMIDYVNNSDVDKLQLLFKDIITTQGKTKLNEYINTKDSRTGKTPLLLALKHLNSPNHYNIISLLIQNGANVDQKDNDGIFPLAELCIAYQSFDRSLRENYYVRINFVSCFDLLIQHNALIDNKTNRDKSLLHFVVENKDSIFLLKYLRDIDKTDNNINHKMEGGITPLHIATGMEDYHTDTVSLLIRSGANPFIKNSKNQTAFDIAIEKGNTDILALLERKTREASKTDETREASKTDETREASKTDETREASKTDETREASKKDETSETINPLHRPGGKKRTIKKPRNTAKKRKLNKKKTKSKNTRK
jgi:hypothetical protein